MFSPVRASQSPPRPSRLAVTTRVPSGLNAACPIHPRCPRRVSFTREIQSARRSDRSASTVGLSEAARWASRMLSSGSIGSCEISRGGKLSRLRNSLLLLAVALGVTALDYGDDRDRDDRDPGDERRGSDPLPPGRRGATGEDVLGLQRRRLRLLVRSLLGEPRLRLA